MPFPESPRVHYGSNPLVEVICQIRFPAILRIASADVADFQERIRKDYPLYDTQDPAFDFPSMPRELSTLVEQLLPKPPGPRIHKFLTKDSGRYISLSQDFLAVSESSYDRWEILRPEIQMAEKALREVYQPALYSRLGLRLRNMIRPDILGLGDRPWRDLLGKHIIAELGDDNVADSIVQTRTRTLITLSEVEGGQVTLTHGIAIDRETTEKSYMIDVDFSIENVEALDDTFKILDKFNRLSGRLFRWTITQTLHDAMVPESI